MASRRDRSGAAGSGRMRGFFGRMLHDVRVVVAVEMRLPRWAHGNVYNPGTNRDMIDLQSFRRIQGSNEYEA